MASFFHQLNDVIHGAGSVIKESLRTLLRDPHIMIYPYLAVIFILITSPFVTHFVISLWHSVETPTVIDNVNQAAPHSLLAHIGLVSFSVYYALFISAFFSYAVSYATIASLQEHKDIGWFDGLFAMFRHFFRVVKFAALAIFFFPLGIISQRRKMKNLRGIVEAISSSFSLSMAQLAPAIVKGHDGVPWTIRHSLDTLGHFWEESIVIRVATFICAVGLGFISLLPKLIQHYWFYSSTAQFAAWVLTGVLGISSFVLLRVTSTVFMTNLYLRAERERRKS
jgi:hypothetical protein